MKDKIDLIAKEMAKQAVFQMTLQEVHSKLFDLFYEETRDKLIHKSESAIDTLYEQYQSE